jgi:putative Mg2+ transporter-C (MgtC) family protein
MEFLDRLDLYFHESFAHLGISGEAIVKLILAAICGGLVGLEREIRGRQAGFRTNLLVCVGSALAMIVSGHVAIMAWPSPPGQKVNINMDPARIAYGVMAGVGFLGAGTILKNNATVRGLTTAAGMWCVAALGLAAGLGMYAVTIGASLLVLLALWLLDYLEDFLPRRHYRAVTARCRWEPGAVSRVVKWLRQSGFAVEHVHFQRRENLVEVDVHARVSFRPKTRLYELERQNVGDIELIAICEA